MCTEAAMRGLQVQGDGLDLERSAKSLGEQLRRQFSDIASEPLPEAMLALLEKLNRVAE
jgi:hypothetical protein